MPEFICTLIMLLISHLYFIEARSVQLFVITNNLSFSRCKYARVLFVIEPTLHAHYSQQHQITRCWRKKIKEERRVNIFHILFHIATDISGSRGDFENSNCALTLTSSGCCSCCVGSHGSQRSWREKSAMSYHAQIHTTYSFIILLSNSSYLYFDLQKS